MERGRSSEPLQGFPERRKIVFVTSSDAGNTFGHYQQLVLLGQGGMAKVYKAYDSSLGRYVALKFIHGEDPELSERFLMEARAQARIEHDRVCKIYEAGEIDGKLYISMQLIEGKTLKEVSSELKTETKVKLIQEVAEAIHAAHRAGLIHRDLKPSNIMVERTEEGQWIPYVLDFGLAREVQAPGRTISGTVIGSPLYMAPEQARGEVRKLDRRSDVYSLGVTLYELLTNQVPFSSENALDVLFDVIHEEPRRVRAVDNSIPQDLETIVMKCLEKEPERRYESARALADDLQRYLNGEPVRARPAGIFYRLSKKAKKQKALVFTAASALLAVLIFGGVAVKARWTAGRQAALAQEFGQQIKEVEAIMRYAYLLPLHDITPEKNIVRKKMDLIKQQIAKMGKTGSGPGNYALGRGHLMLHEYDLSYEYLTNAWRQYPEPAVAYALGLVLGELYQKELEEAQRIGSEDARKKRIHQVEKQYKDAALSYLQRGAASSTDSPEYVKAMLAFYDKQWTAALKLAQQAIHENPWLYEARRLEGDTYLALANEARIHGEGNHALELLKKAQNSYQNAEDKARSDDETYQNECGLWNTVMSIKNERGDNPEIAFQNALTACKKAITVNFQSFEAYDKQAFSYSRWADYQFYGGQDPRDAYTKSIELSRKVIALKSSWGSPYKNIGYCYLGLADYAANYGKPYKDLFGKAAESYRKAITLNRNDPVPYHNIGFANTRLAALSAKEGSDPRPYSKQAIENYEKALILDPEQPYFVWNNLGIEYERQGEYVLEHGGDPSSFLSRALEYYEKATRNNPEYAYP